MKKASNNAGFVNIILHIIGLLFCVVPPAICTLSYFPLWTAVGGGRVIAGGAALLLVMCAIPIVKFLRKNFESFASYLMWLCAFLIFLLLSRIAEEMTVITFVGFVSNLIGAVFFAFAKRYKVKRDE